MALEPTGPLTDRELEHQRRIADQIADLCQLHGETDGATAARAIGRALAAEAAQRARG